MKSIFKTKEQEKRFAKCADEFMKISDENFDELNNTKQLVLKRKKY